MKNKNRQWINYLIMAVILLTLYFTGLHTKIIGLAQRGVLMTGIIKPDVAQSENEVFTDDYPDADFNFKLIDIKGNIVSLKQFKGKVIFINLWATWCPPCVAEMPGIDKLHKSMNDMNVVFLMVSLDRDFKKAIEFKSKMDYALDVYAPSGALPPMYQSTNIPTTFVINAEGKLVLTHKGMADYNSQEFKTFLLGLK